MHHKKLLQKILSGRSDKNIRFEELTNLLQRLGFNERIKGSHHIFVMKDAEEIVNLQSDSGNAKPYQVKQVRGIVLKYKLEVK